MTGLNPTWCATYAWAIPSHMLCHVPVRGQDRDGIFPPSPCLGSSTRRWSPSSPSSPCRPLSAPTGSRARPRGRHRAAPHSQQPRLGHETGSTLQRGEQGETGEHLTPRGAVTLMAKLFFLASAHRIDVESASPMTAPMRKAASSRPPRGCSTGSRKSGADSHTCVTRSRPATHARGAKSVFSWTTESSRDRHPPTCARYVP